MQPRIAYIYIYIYIYNSAQGAREPAEQIVQKAGPVARYAGAGAREASQCCVFVLFIAANYKQRQQNKRDKMTGRGQNKDKINKPRRRHQIK